MQSNPIQRKTRNAFLLGMLITFIVVAIIIFILYFTVFSDMFSEKLGEGEGEKVNAYRLTAAVKSGEKITANKVEVVELSLSELPKDYVRDEIRSTTYNSKLNLQAGTILSSSLLYETEKNENSTRLMEYNMLTLPSTLSVGDYIDVRFTVPSGQNYIVLSKKQVKDLNNTTVTLYLTEDEILMMSSAIIESYIMKASNLHVVQYVEAGLQEAAIPTYAVNDKVCKLIAANGGIVISEEDVNKIKINNESDLRDILEQELEVYGMSAAMNVEEGIEKEKETSMQLYLSGLQGY